MSVTNEEVNGPGIGGSTTTNTTSTTTNTTASGSSSVSSSATVSPPSLNNISLLYRSSPNVSANNNREDVVKCGNLRKLKGKKKFFVLRKENVEAAKPARLEYYANEKKFNLGHPPKKSITLKHCFNINRTEAKVKFAVALHTHNDCVRIAFNSEEEMNDWLRIMNSLAGDEEDQDGPEETLLGGGGLLPIKPSFEHVWLVQAFNKGLGSQEGILGSYRLCLTSKELTLLKVGEHDDKNSMLKFPLPVIRNVSHDAIGCFFHIEFGRLACTGAGKLSLKTEDNNIAQNMHLLILKAMKNYQKDEFLPRDHTRTGRTRTATWSTTPEDNTGGTITSTTTGCSSYTRSGSFRNTPPGMPRIRSVDSSISRLRSESMSSTCAESARRLSGMSPPVPVPPTPTSAYKRMNHHHPTAANISSTDSANSASSSYSIDYENNNGYSKSHEDDGTMDESYVPWNPGEDSAQQQHQPIHHQHSLSLPLQSSDTSDYVETSVGAMNGVGTPSSSNADFHSPLSPCYDNYIPMSPAGAMMSSQQRGGKISVSHSRNSSLIEDHDGYVPMIPSGVSSHVSNHSRSESAACSTSGSTTGLDDSYLDMDFSRKLNMSNDDMRRMSPASSGSIQSGTPSSDYQLDKVHSFLATSDDFDDGSICMRPVRAYSVGSRSDTSSTGKGGGGRYGKNRLEAVQEAHRTRAMSVGSKQNPRRPVMNAAAASTSAFFNRSSNSSSSSAPLSSSWSGSTGRWLQSKAALLSHNNLPPVQMTYSPTINHAATDSADSDLMELDFSHNKHNKSRKRSLPGPGNLSAGGSTNKLSPCARAVLANNTCGFDTSPSLIDMADLSKNPLSTSPRYPTSAPISIQKSDLNGGADCGGAYCDQSNSILKRITGFDLKKLKELDDDGAYIAMDFGANKTLGGPPMDLKSKPPTGSKINNVVGEPVVIRATDKVTPAKFPSPEGRPTSPSLSCKSNVSTTSNSSSTSAVSVKGPALSPERTAAPPATLVIPSTSAGAGLSSPNNVGPMCTLARIEESPEKLNHHGLNGVNHFEGTALNNQLNNESAYVPMQPGGKIISAAAVDDDHVAYTTIEHFPSLPRHGSFPSDLSKKLMGAAGPRPLITCAKQCQSPLMVNGAKAHHAGPHCNGNNARVSYAQVEFLKSSNGAGDEVKRN